MTDEDRLKRLNFYTATGITNEQIVCELFGEDHVLQIEELRNDNYLHLDREVFANKLQANAAVV